MKKSLLIISVLVSGLANSFAQTCQIGLTSSVGTDTQAVCKNTAITSITYSVSNTGASVAGLPSGLTSQYNANVFTISGTPSVAGIFNYTVTTTGTACTPNAIATGSLTVNEATINLTSSGGTDDQAVSKNIAITNITYQIGGTGTGDTITYLSGTTLLGTTFPAGLTATYNAGLLTISGTPSVPAGVYTYTVTPKGTCIQNSEMFKLTILSCTTDPTISTSASAPAILPDTNVVTIEKPDSVFFQTYTIYAPVNANFTPAGIPIAVQATIDSLHIDGVTGIPSTFTVTCGTPDCMVYGGQVGCFTVQGIMPAKNDTLYKFHVTISPYGLITGPSTILSFLGSNTTIQGNVSHQAFATYKVQVGTPPPPTGIQSFDMNQFNVSQNKPNPFDDNTVINFNCPVSCKVDFTVVDILGRQVYDTNISATAGSNTFTFNTDLASGTYFFSISNGNNKITRKMVVTGH